MAPSEAQKRAAAKWDKKNVTTLGCKVKREQAEAFKGYAESKGKTSNTLLRDYVLDCIGDKTKPPATDPQLVDTSADAVADLNPASVTELSTDTPGYQLVGLVGTFMRVEQRDEWSGAVAKLCDDLEGCFGKGSVGLDPAAVTKELRSQEVKKLLKDKHGLVMDFENKAGSRVTIKRI